MAGVAVELLRFGRELEASAAAQVGGSFSGDADADALITASPNAFLFGVLFTQGIPAERAWSAPLRLLERLGTLEPHFIAGHPEEVRVAVQAPPMLHRFKNTLPGWIVDAAAMLVDEYDGSAANIWPAGSTVIDVADRLGRFRGIGRKKAVMATEILARHFGVELVGRECGQVAFDVHVRRVFLRTGLAAADTREAVEAAARAACSESPGTLDLPAWLIGRDWCRPREPRCESCRLRDACPRLVGIDVEGVGRRRTDPAIRRT